MVQQLFYVLPLVLSTLAIRIETGTSSHLTDEGLDDIENGPSTVADIKQDTSDKSDGEIIDSYLIPPEEHVLAEVLQDRVVTPATYLLPPLEGKATDYYTTSEASDQTDWYPIAQVPVQNSTGTGLLPVKLNAVFVPFRNQSSHPRGSKSYEGGKTHTLEISTVLEPPSKDAFVGFDSPKPHEEQQKPLMERNPLFNFPQTNNQIPIHKIHLPAPNKNPYHLKIVQTKIPLHLTPPKYTSSDYKIPTKLYPKKVFQEFKRVPIPLAEYGDSTPALEILKAKRVKPFKPVSIDVVDYFTPSNDKSTFLYQQTQQNNLGVRESKFQQPLAAVEDTYGVNAPAEQETSETNYRHPGRNVYPAPLRVTPPVPPPAPKKPSLVVPAPGERTEFRMHGMNGPHSYQFGFDTGKGKNRQFRFEERDNDGRVKGHYGYMDKRGKLRVVNYGADPETGFHAETPTDTEEGDDSDTRQRD